MSSVNLDLDKHEVLVIDPSGIAHLLLFENGDCWGTDNIARMFGPKERSLAVRKYLVQRIYDQIIDGKEEGTESYPPHGTYKWETWYGC